MMGIIVANVPEGLLPTFTLSLAMGSLRMARKNVLVTSLNAVEGLGATQVICTDKTGTLTRNQLTVARLTTPFSSKDSNAAPFRCHLLEAALLACDLHSSGEGLSGDPLDVAIAVQMQIDAGKPDLPLVVRDQSFPFDSDLKRSAGLGMIGGERVFSVKGAWEVLRPVIAEVYESEHQVSSVSPAVLERIDHTLHELAISGMRVVAVASRLLAPLEEQPYRLQTLEQNLRLEGFIAIEDPIRDEVPAAIACCHNAGIDVILITGDHPDTARSVARQCGISSEHQQTCHVMTGDVLEASSLTELQQALVDGVRIFARTSPTQKMKIVMALKRLGRVVAMTGDGVNDAPALKAADIGIAMGKGGTDVARAVAQIILLDDNFASIVDGIEEGRTVFLNIRKFTNYVLVSNGPEIIPYLLYVVLPVPLALTVIQILAIDLGTDIIPSMALGQEPPEPEVMTQPPRDREFYLLTKELVVHSYLFLGLLEAFWALGLFFYVLLAGGWCYGAELSTHDPLYRSATGIALATVILMQIGNLIGRRHLVRSGFDRGLLTNPLLLLGILTQIAFSWGLLYFPPLQNILGTAPVDWPLYLISWLGIPLIWGADYARKRICRQRIIS